ncbi:MAG: lipocalin family protein [Fulvivirga sp.]
MKQLIKFFMLAAMVAFILTSCGDDDEDSGISLEGTVWVEKSFSSTGCDDPDDNESGSSTCTSSNCSTILLSGGTFTSTEIEGGVTETSSGTYVVSGNTITVTFSDGGFSISFDVTFSISGNTLTISFEDPSDGCMNSGTFEAQG